LLLLEFVNRDPWAWNSRYFPHVAGLARAAGVEVLWYWLGTDFALARIEGALEFAAALPPSDLTTLGEAVGAFQPTHVLTSHPLADELAACVRGPVSAPSLRCWADVTSPRAETGAGPERDEPPGAAPPEWAAARTDWLAAWLAPEPAGPLVAGHYLVGAAEPWYGAEPGNEAARAVRPPLVIVGGVECDDPRPIALNPAYRDVDLSHCAATTGCAFCTTYRGPTSEPGDDPVRTALAQLSAAARSGRAGGRFTGLVHLHDARLFGHLECFVAAVIAEGLPRSTFVLSPRVDRFLAAAPELERALPALSAAGHVLRLGRMGAESLVDAENARLHKGLTLTQLDDAVALLARLTRRFPTAFDWEGTFAYITFTPWTTLDDARALIDRAIERGLPPRDGWLYTPLELRRGSAVTELARGAGDLLQERFPDAAFLYEPALGGISTGSLVPWRFRDARTGLLFALAVRYVAATYRAVLPDAVLADDPLYQEVLAEGGRRGLPFRRPELFARDVGALLATSGEPPDVRDLLYAALDLRAAHPVEPSDDERSSLAAPAVASPRARRLCAAAVAAVPALRGLTVREVTTGGEGGALRLELALGGVPYRLDLLPRGASPRCLFHTACFDVVHGAETPVRDPEHAQTLHLLIDAVERLARRHAPELLPEPGKDAATTTGRAPG